MLTAQQIIEKYQLKKHREGGYFKEIYKDDVILNFGEKYEGSTRHLFTSIYFLLTEEEQSALHVINNSTEIWHYHSGSPIQLTIIDPITGHIEKAIIGNPADGYDPQYVIPGSKWFGAECIDKKGYSFLGCIVAPGFDYRDFSLITEEQLLKLLPDAPADVLNLIHVNVDITQNDIINAPINNLWSIISDFNALPNWHPAIKDSYIESGRSNNEIGCIRNFNLNNNGGNIREELVVLDNKNYLVTYKILNSPMLLSNYVATLKLEHLNANQTKIVWECHFNCHLKHKPLLHKIISTDVFQAGFEALKKTGELGI